MVVGTDAACADAGLVLGDRVLCYFSYLRFVVIWPRITTPFIGVRIAGCVGEIVHHCDGQAVPVCSSLRIRGRTRRQSDTSWLRRSQTSHSSEQGKHRFAPNPAILLRKYIWCHLGCSVGRRRQVGVVGPFMSRTRRVYARVSVP